MSPFENEQWIRNMIATGVITPPRDEMGAGERRHHIYIIGFLLLVGAFFWLGMGFR
jgi:hypothetical protein